MARAAGRRYARQTSPIHVRRRHSLHRDASDVMPSPVTDRELFEQFLRGVQIAAASQLSLDVLPHSLPNTIQWGKLDDPHLYTFVPDRARSEGLEHLVAEAIARIRSDMP